MHDRTCNADGCTNLVGRKGARGYCPRHYQRVLAGRPLEPEAKTVHETCTVADCDSPPRSTYATLCLKHYHREYRHGDSSRVAKESGISVSPGRKYKTRYAPDHPLASKHGIVYEHRMILFDAIGYGPHPCHYCNALVNWTARGEANELQPDHVNNEGDDNRIDNLVVCCRSCNVARAQQARHMALTEAGWWSQNDTIANLGGGRRKPVESP